MGTISETIMSKTTLRQCAAELLALSVIDLFPGALLVESVATEQGFYCDIIAEQPIDDYALPLIEEKMRSFAKQNLEVRVLEMMKEVAANYLDHHGQPIRSDAVRNAKENIVSIIQIGNFSDYCPQPYVSGTRELEFFKILRVEKASHYLPEEGMVDVKRVHGIVSTDKQSLKQAVKACQSGRKADHTKMFSFQDDVSSIAWTWDKQGAQLKDLLIDWWKKEHEQQEFSLLSNPALIKESLLRRSGIDDDLPNMEIEGISYVVAPSATPAHLAFFHQQAPSFKEMPVRYAELAPTIFQEKNSFLWGLFNARLVSADYTHIFCAPEHLEGELISSLQFIDKTIKMFGFEYRWHLTERGQRFAGTVNRWEKATKSLIEAFEQSGLTYTSIQETTFAGPTAETCLIDRFGREWKGPNVSLDLYAPDRFGLRYVGPDGKSHVPIMIKRSLFGSLERFAALLLEHTSGLVPSWLAPKQ